MFMYTAIQHGFHHTCILTAVCDVHCLTVLLFCSTAGPWLLSQSLILQYPHFILCLPDPSSSHCCPLQLYPSNTYSGHYHHLHHLVSRSMCSDAYTHIPALSIVVQWLRCVYDCELPLVAVSHNLFSPLLVLATSVPSAPEVRSMAFLSLDSSSTHTLQMPVFALLAVK